MAVAVLLAAVAVPTLSGRAAGDSIGDIRAERASLQAQLDALTFEIEELRTQKEQLGSRVAEIEARMKVLNRKNEKLQKRAITVANELYKSGGMGTIQVLLGSEDFTELQNRASMLSHVSSTDVRVFITLSRSQAELEDLSSELSDRRAEVSDTEADLVEKSERLQAAFTSLGSRLAALSTEIGPPPPVSVPEVSVRSTGGMSCPVAGPVSFTDTWGAPRAGHTHQGVDMMAAYGTPIVAIVSGTITYAAYDGSGGNMIFLSGDDGNAYWYMHNQSNLVTGGHVSGGQQIATVGDTGNAAGTPHLHFEFHPGGGAAVNPTPLVASVC
jgi:murein DD-endopeptidase MepM/ murein hydrolase activator NlpD